MYPKVSLINKDKSNLVVFESDVNNPLNEGFVAYWEIVKSNNKQLIFKKRLTTKRAQKKLTMLEEEGWIKINEIDQVA
ncbi:MAG: hypothetical protein JJ844_00275 [Prochlorococcus marinus CUG1435]|nr:hypothetical protein [Prochlorococcus marinus CUG1435]